MCPWAVSALDSLTSFIVHKPQQPTVGTQPSEAERLEPAPPPPPRPPATMRILRFPAFWRSPTFVVVASILKLLSPQNELPRPKEEAAGEGEVGGGPLQRQHSQGNQNLNE